MDKGEDSSDGSTKAAVEDKGLVCISRSESGNEIAPAITTQAVINDPRARLSL